MNIFDSNVKIINISENVLKRINRLLMNNSDYYLITPIHSVTILIIDIMTVCALTFFADSKKLFIEIIIRIIIRKQSRKRKDA